MLKVVIAMGLAFQFTHFPPEELIVKSEDEKNNEKIQRSEAYYVMEDLLFINQNKMNEIAGKLNKKVYKAPKNARLLDTESIEPEKRGVELDRYAFEEKYMDFLIEGKVDSMNIPVKPVHPRVTSEVISEIKTKKIGSYTTHFRQNNKERTLNMKLAAKAIDSHVIFPGDRFSFNEVVGERTKQKGYKSAPVIVKGEFSEGIGGGICQVSSTLFNAVNIKGIKIIERYMHSRDVSYVPPGKDATVSWHGPDFVFKNSYNQPILIKAAVANGQMRISIYSAEDARPN